MATEPLIKPDGCGCSDWDTEMPKINGPIILASIRAGHNTYDGKPFRFCPWCGSKLPNGCRSHTSGRMRL
jgi:hypothetical protein